MNAVSSEFLRLWHRWILSEKLWIPSSLHNQSVQNVEPFCPADASGQFLRERLSSFDTEAPTESLLLQESERLGAGAFLCLGTLCVSVSVASAAQSQVKYPPPTVQSVRGACPPRPLSLWLTAPPPGHPLPSQRGKYQPQSQRSTGS